MSNNNFFYRKDGRLRKINPEDIRFLKAEDNYVQFYERGEVHIIRITLETALRQLPQNMFVRIHRSYAVAVNRITTISKGAVSLGPIGRFRFPVSKQHYALLMERIEILGNVVVCRKLNTEQL